MGGERAHGGRKFSPRAGAQRAAARVEGRSAHRPWAARAVADDVVEFRRDDAHGVPLAGKHGLWLPYPVEYKRGAPKQDSCDELQLCAQAMCLEEMLCCEVPDGALFYGEPRRRLAVSFTPELREEVRTSAAQMHDLYRRGYTPRVKPTKACNACSLRELCLPRLQKSGSVQVYLQRSMEETP